VDKCSTVVYCHSDLVLKGFCWACIDGLVVIFSYEAVYFHVVVLYRKNDYRISFISSSSHSFFVFYFVFIDFNVRISEFVM